MKTRFKVGDKVRYKDSAWPYQSGTGTIRATAVAGFQYALENMCDDSAGPSKLDLFYESEVTLIKAAPQPCEHCKGTGFQQ